MLSVVFCVLAVVRHSLLVVGCVLMLARGSLVVARCLLFVGCCLSSVGKLCAVCCALCAVLGFAVRCLMLLLVLWLCVVAVCRWLLSVGVCCVVRAVSLFAVCCVLCVAC